MSDLLIRWRCRDANDARKRVAQRSRHVTVRAAVGSTHGDDLQEV
jgi:hypothetical protein